MTSDALFQIAIAVATVLSVVLGLLLAGAAVLLQVVHTSATTARLQSFDAAAKLGLFLSSEDELHQLVSDNYLVAVGDLAQVLSRVKPTVHTFDKFGFREERDAVVARFHAEEEECRGHQRTAIAAFQHEMSKPSPTQSEALRLKAHVDQYRTFDTRLTPIRVSIDLSSRALDDFMDWHRRWAIAKRDLDRALMPSLLMSVSLIVAVITKITSFGPGEMQTVNALTASGLVVGTIGIILYAAHRIRLIFLD